MNLPYIYKPIALFLKFASYSTMTKLISAIFIFYKPAILVSVLITILLLGLNTNLFLILVLKLFLTFFIWYLINETNKKSAFIFYQNIGIQPWQIILGTYFLDSSLSTLLFTLSIIL